MSKSFDEVAGINTYISMNNVQYLLRNTEESFYSSADKKRAPSEIDDDFTEVRLGVFSIGSSEDDEAINTESNIKNISDEIAKFISNIDLNNSETLKASFPLCRGTISIVNGQPQITGATHWTALHLRIDPATKKLLFYYMNSSGNFDDTADKITPAITNIVEFLTDKASPEKYFSKDFANSQEVFPRFQQRINSLSISNKVTVLNCAQQTGPTCGYHAVYNALKMHHADNLATLDANSQIFQNGSLINTQNFVNQKLPILQQKFGKGTAAPVQNFTPILPKTLNFSNNTAFLEKINNNTPDHGDLKDLVFKICYEKSIDVHTKFKDGNTVLHLVAMSNIDDKAKAKLIKELIKFGADPTLENAERKTAKEVAEDTAKSTSAAGTGAAATSKSTQILINEEFLVRLSRVLSDPGKKLETENDISGLADEKDRTVLSLKNAKKVDLTYPSVSPLIAGDNKSLFEHHASTNNVDAYNTFIESKLNDEIKVTAIDLKNMDDILSFLNNGVTNNFLHCIKNSSIPSWSTNLDSANINQTHLLLLDQIHKGHYLVAKKLIEECGANPTFVGNIGREEGELAPIEVNMDTAFACNAAYNGDGSDGDKKKSALEFQAYLEQAIIRQMFEMALRTTGCAVTKDEKGNDVVEFLVKGRQSLSGKELSDMFAKITKNAKEEFVIEYELRDRKTGKVLHEEDGSKSAFDDTPNRLPNENQTVTETIPMQVLLNEFYYGMDKNSITFSTKLSPIPPQAELLEVTEKKVTAADGTKTTQQEVSASSKLSLRRSGLLDHRRGRRFCG